MKFVLFCKNAYAFGIMEPIARVLRQKGHSYLWFLTSNLKGSFPFEGQPVTFNLEELVRFKSDVIFCPGNEVPHYLRGVKVQIFHGLAGEKKGHFKIRHYFDLYLTQGPYFTRRFQRLKKRHKNFEVRETGWSKLDVYGGNREVFQEEKKRLLDYHQASTMVLYAPTFSPSLTSAPFLLQEIQRLAENPQYLVLVKFHDLMDVKIKEQYKTLSRHLSQLVIEEDPNIARFLLMADLLISDTSSVVYEFLLLDKPVITFRSNAQHIAWDNSKTYSGLAEKVHHNLAQDPFSERRQAVIKEYHPYHDGASSQRMIEAAEEYVQNHGVPERRKLPFLRRRKMNRMFPRKKWRE